MHEQRCRRLHTAACPRPHPRPRDCTGPPGRRQAHGRFHLRRGWWWKTVHRRCRETRNSLASAAGPCPIQIGQSNSHGSYSSIPRAAACAETPVNGLRRLLRTERLPESWDRRAEFHQFLSEGRRLSRYHRRALCLRTEDIDVPFKAAAVVDSDASCFQVAQKGSRRCGFPACPPLPGRLRACLQLPRRCNYVSVHSGFGPDGEPATGHVNVPFHFSVHVEVFATFNVAGDAY